MKDYFVEVVEARGELATSRLVLQNLVRAL